MKRVGTSRSQRAAGTAKRAKRPKLPLYDRIDSFAFLSPDIIGDVVAISDSPRGALDSHDLKALMQINGAWGQLAVPGWHREIKIEYKEEIRGYRKVQREGKWNFTLEQRRPLRYGGMRVNRSVWEPLNAEHLRCQRDEINECTNRPINSFVVHQDCDQKLDLPLQELDFFRNLYGTLELQDELPVALLDALPTRFDEIKLTNVFRYDVQPYELDFLKRQLRSKYLTKLSLSWEQFPDDTIPTELVNFVKNPQFEELVLEWTLHIDIVKEFYYAWTKREHHERRKQRLAGNFGDDDEIDELEAFFPLWKKREGSPVVFSEAHPKTPGCKLTGKDRVIVQSGDQVFEFCAEDKPKTV